MSRSDKQIYRLADAEVDASRGSIRRDGEERHLRQQTLKVLLYLIENRERGVSKEELMREIWNGTAVTDDALVQCIGDIRRALGDDSRRPRFIKTIPKVGYSLIAPVEVAGNGAPLTLQTEEITSIKLEYEEEIASPASAEAITHSPTALAPRRRSGRKVALASGAALLLIAAMSAGLYWRGKRQASTDQPQAATTIPRVAGKKALAVMHFQNLSGDADLDWLREGLADMLITGFSRSKKLSVLGRGQLHLLLERAGNNPGASIRLDEALVMARKAQAEVVVTGSFSRLEGKIRVDVQLSDALSGQLLASERLVVEQPAQLLTQVDLLSLKLASSLSAPADVDASAGLTSVMTNNLQAYRYYSLGVEKANELLYAEAVALLEEAVRLDPEFAMAYARIGYTYALSWVRPDEAKPYLERAFQLSGRLTEKDRLSITAWYAVAHQDYSAAIETYRKIISLYPLEVEAYWRLSRLLRGEERMEESVEVARQGLALDSEAKDIYNVLGVTYMEMGRHDEAIATLLRYIELAPDDPNIYDSLGMAYQWAGRYAEAIQTFEKALALNPRFEIAILHLGNTYVWQGRYREALRQYQQFMQVASFDGTRARGYDSIAMLHLKRKKLDEAERAARAALKHEKRQVSSALLLALERGDQATAEKHMAIVEATPAFERGNRGYERARTYLRGYLAFKSGRVADALEHFKQTVRHRPLAWYIDAFEDSLANAYLEQGRLDEAIAEYERILRLNPNYPLAHYRLAQAFERKGEPQQARAHYERFLQIWKDADPDVPEVLKAKQALI